jgi:hypothetical protein
MTVTLGSSLPSIPVLSVDIPEVENFKSEFVYCFLFFLFFIYFRAHDKYFGILIAALLLLGGCSREATGQMPDCMPEEMPAPFAVSAADGSAENKRQWRSR